MTAYHVTVIREGESWLADVPGLAGTHTWARNLPALDRAVREVIALAEDLDEGAESNLAIEYTYRTGDPGLDDAAAEVRAERDRLVAAERALVTRTQSLAEKIVTQRGLSVRDAAALLKVSPQRISQIVPQRAASSRETPQRRADVVRGGKGKQLPAASGHSARGGKGGRPRAVPSGES